MQILEKEEVLEKEDIWFTLLKVLNHKEVFTKKQLARNLGMLYSSQKFFMIVKFLEESGFLEVNKITIPYICKLNKKKLAKFLRQSRIMDNEIKNLIKLNSCWGITADI